MTASGSDRGSGGQKPTVRAQRRRPGGSTPAGGRERAQAPRREGRDSGGYRATDTPPPTQSGGAGLGGGSSYGSGGASGSGGAGLGGSLLKALLGGGATRSGGRRRLPGLLVLVLIACVVIYLVSRCGGALGGLGGGALAPEQQEAPVVEEQPADAGWDVGSGELPTATPAAATGGLAPVATATPRPAVAPASSGADTWLVMLYQDADDKILEKDIYLDLNEAERIGSTDQVQIVAQVDRFNGGFSADGNWTATRRYHVTQDLDLNTVGSEVVAELGEVNMADGNTLVDFVTWAVETYPADKHVLILSDHGMGWPGGWSDPAPATMSERGTPLAAAAGNQLYLNELDEALGAIRQRTGLDKFELIGMDACLMGQLEVFSMLSEHGRYAVASEETEPGLGWAYAGFLQALADNPGMTGGDLGKLIVDSYITDDQRIVDDAARADLLRQGSPMGSLFGGFSVPSSAQVANQMGRDVTLSAVDLTQVPALVGAVNDLSLALQDANQKAVAKARTYALAFTNVFSQETPSPYIDLGHFMQLLPQANAGGATNTAANNALNALRNALVAEKHGAGKQGATGMAIYYPNSTLYRNPATGPASYTAIASQFATASLWDDFLAFHYTGRNFDANTPQGGAPAAGGAISAPGAGPLTMSAVQASATTAAPGRPILLSADVSGENLGYVMLFAGYYDRAANSLNIADTDYLESSDTREVDGVYYPVWPETTFRLEFEWEPIVYYLSDGANEVPVTLMPEAYGRTAEQAVYTVDGVYTYQSGEQVRARLYLQDGQLKRVFGFVGEGAGAPREIYPERGDRFTVYDRWLDMDAQGRVVQQAAQEGGTLTFGNQMFTWVEYDAAAGDYVVGFIAKDLDGNQRQSYAQVTVR